MRVLGVDPGLSRCGVGVVDGPGRKPSIVRAGVIATAPAEPTATRLRTIHADLVALIAELRPDAVAVERVFFNANVRTAMGVGQAAGVALLAAEQAGIPVVEYTPTQVKAAVAGAGDAHKDQVAFMVRALLCLAEIPKQADAADALALALCHLQHAVAPGSGTMSDRLAAAYRDAAPGAQVIRHQPGPRVRPQPCQPDRRLRS